ncbi:MAG: hypothetical protein U0Z44_20725 [Kouleothrix sp.]
MAYTDDQRQRIAAWIEQKVPRLTAEGCPLCTHAGAGYGVERVVVQISTCRCWQWPAATAVM